MSANTRAKLSTSYGEYQKKVRQPGAYLPSSCSSRPDVQLGSSADDSLAILMPTSGERLI
jgi:hypothetical protein